MYTITVRQPNGTSVHAALTPGRPCVVGRVAQRSELVVDDPAVSGKHLQITEEAGDLWIEDLESSNGTYLEADRLTALERKHLSPGQQVSFGASLLQVEEEGGWDQTRIGGVAWKPKYVGVLYSDIVDSTRTTFRLGPERMMTMMNWHNQMFRERFKRFKGKETKFTGDGFEAVFATVSEALSCAAACQRELARHNHEHPADAAVYVRMGVNAGEAPTAGKKVYGTPLIVAARVMSKADGDQILVPAHVVGMMIGSLFSFAPFGKHELKGIDQPIELYEFLWRRDPAIYDISELPPAQRRGTGVAAERPAKTEALG